jgi:DNA-directed RNA polymerase subunit E'/Rpb7
MSEMNYGEWEMNIMPSFGAIYPHAAFRKVLYNAWSHEVRTGKLNKWRMEGVFFAVYL